MCKLMSITLFFISTTLFFACGDDSPVNNDSNNNPEPMMQWVGTWTVVTLDNNGQFVLDGFFEKGKFYPNNQWC